MAYGSPNENGSHQGFTVTHTPTGISFNLEGATPMDGSMPVTGDADHTSDASLAFQAVIDALAASPDLTVPYANRQWYTVRGVTPTP